MCDSSIDISFFSYIALPEKGVTPVNVDDKAISLNSFANICYKNAEELLV